MAISDVIEISSETDSDCESPPPWLRAPIGLERADTTKDEVFGKAVKFIELLDSAKDSGSEKPVPRPLPHARLPRIKRTPQCGPRMIKRDVGTPCTSRTEVSVLSRSSARMDKVLRASQLSLWEDQSTANSTAFVVQPNLILKGVACHKALESMALIFSKQVANLQQKDGAAVCANPRTGRRSDWSGIVIAIRRVPNMDPPRRQPARSARNKKPVYEDDGDHGDDEDSGYSEFERDTVDESDGESDAEMPDAAPEAAAIDNGLGNALDNDSDDSTPLARSEYQLPDNHVPTRRNFTNVGPMLHRFGQFVDGSDADVPLLDMDPGVGSISSNLPSTSRARMAPKRKAQPRSSFVTKSKKPRRSAPQHTAKVSIMELLNLLDYESNAESDLDLDLSAMFEKSGKRSAEPKVNSKGKQEASVATAPTDSEEETEANELAEDAYAAEEDPIAQSNFRHGVDGWNSNLPPLNKVSQFFEDMADKAVDKNIQTMLKFILDKRLTFATMCSGSEAPMLGLLEFQRALLWKYQSLFPFRQAFAAEIHPAKAAFINRNGTTKLILRDIVEFILGAEDPGDLLLTTSYGAKTVLKEKVHVLIAGFACDDFSSLNNYKKLLEDKGESGDTFHAILAYMVRYKPAMVILENVSGAPWVHAKLGKAQTKSKNPRVGIDEHLQDVGYYTQFERVDSKQFYVPHTRVRGYMLAVRKDLFDSKQESWQLLQDFSNLFTSFKRAPSAPAEAFMFRSDDPHLSVLKQQVAVTERKKSEWVKASIQHDSYRAVNHFGTNRPVTQWRSDGSRKLPDWFRSFLAMSERVADSIDIAHLRNIRRLVDDRYYSRILELSQNVYRVTDITKQSTIGCCMPNNLLFSTVEGRRITGIEALMFQATPTHLADYSNMSEALLHDLAGNAMTSTVVTAFTLAALMTFYARLGLEDGYSNILEEPSVDFKGREYLIPRQVSLDDCKSTSVASVTRLAAALLKYCYCEMQNETTTLPLQQCKICQQTTCTKCGVEPQHSYQIFKKSQLKHREIPSNLDRHISELLPGELDVPGWMSIDIEGHLAALSDVLPPSATESEWERALKIVKGALSTRVFLREVRRSWSIEVLYDSPDAIVKGFVSKEGVEWRLYANVPKEPLGSPVGKFFRRFPVARLRPTGDNFLAGRWQLWIPKSRDFAVTLTSSGKPIESFQCERGLVAEHNMRTFPTIQLDIDFKDSDDGFYFERDICGVYTAAPTCGQAFNSFHIRQSDIGKPNPLGLFLDVPLRSGTPNDTHFVVSTQFQRLDHGVYRDSFAQLLTWRQPEKRVVKDAIDKTPLELYEGPVVEKDVIHVPGFWASAVTLLCELRPATKIKQLQIAEQLETAAVFDCDNNYSFLELSAQLPLKVPDAFLRGKWEKVTRIIQADFWREMGWLFTKSSVLVGHTESTSKWHALPNDMQHCSNCAPSPPNLHWVYKPGRNAASNLVAKEDPKKAAEYEDSIRHRPECFTAFFRMQDNSVGTSLEFRLVGNPMTLAHRARAFLAATGPSSGISLSWRLITDDDSNRKPNVSIYDMPRTDNMATAAQPFDRAGIALQREQRRALEWMILQEKKPRPFKQEQIVEGVVRDIGYRLEGRATCEKTVAGGVLAQGVGFGKTVVTLGLIASNSGLYQEQSASRMTQEPSKRIPTKATLILMPPHLLGQWESEIEKFMGSAPIVLAVKNLVTLKKYTIQDFIHADIIVVAWSIFESETYFGYLAQFAGMIPPATMKNSRLTRIWYESALNRVAENLDQLRQDPQGFEDYLEGKFYESKAAAMSAEVPVPSRHVTGAAYKNSDARLAEAQVHENHDSEHAHLESDEEEVETLSDDGTAPNTGGAPKEETKKTPKLYDPSWKWKFPGIAQTKGKKTRAKGTKSRDDPNKQYLLFKFPLFEMFTFNRLVIDEFTYIKSHLLTVLELLEANRTWILSATPRLASFDYVKAMATLLHINLGSDDYSNMVAELYSDKFSKLTSSEQMVALADVSSAALREHYHEQAKRFLFHFARSDAARCEQFPMYEFTILISQSAAEMAMYSELQQNVAASNFVGKPTSTNGGNREQMVRDLGFCLDGRELLFMRASSQFSPDPENGASIDRSMSANQMSDYVANVRHAELRDMLRTFTTEAKKALWLADHVTNNAELDLFREFVERISKNHFGDAEATKYLRKALKNASKEFQANEEVWTEFYKDPRADQNDPVQEALPVKPDGLIVTASSREIVLVDADLRTSTSALNKMSQEVLARTRGFRFFQSVRNIKDDGPYSCVGCAGLVDDRANIFVLTTCGHTLCATCVTRQDSSDKCPASDCGALNMHHQRLNGASLAGNSTADDTSCFGTKLDTVVDLINSFGKAEKVLVFVQFEKTESRLKKALAAANIGFCDLDDCRNASLVLEEFKENAKTQVMILKVDDAGAAGSNLVNARHVLFLQPFYTTGSDARAVYVAARTQAIGRSRRHGQTRPVFVYNLLTAGTIDVDYVEAREGKIVEKVETIDDLPAAEAEALRAHPAFDRLPTLTYARLTDRTPATPHGAFCSTGVGLVSFDDTED